MTIGEKIHNLFFQDLNLREKLKLNLFVAPYLLNRIRDKYPVLSDTVDEIKNVLKTHEIQMFNDQEYYYDKLRKKYCESVRETLIKGGIGYDKSIIILNIIFSMFTCLYLHHDIDCLTIQYCRFMFEKRNEEHHYKNLEEILKYGNEVEERRDYVTNND